MALVCILGEIVFVPTRADTAQLPPVLFMLQYQLCHILHLALGPMPTVYYIDSKTDYPLGGKDSQKQHIKLHHFFKFTHADDVVFWLSQELYDSGNVPG